MPDFSTFDQFGGALAAAHREAVADGVRRGSKAMAAQAQKLARRAAADDLGGDPKFSGWRPRLATQVKPTRGRPGHALLPTRTSAGPWTVAEVGRNQGGATGFQGPGVNRRTGTTSRRADGSVRAVRRRRGRRWNGYTAGFGTASRAVADMERDLPELMEREVRRVMMRHVGVD